MTIVDILESLLSALAPLVYPVVIPVPALMILVPLAWGTMRWSRRRRSQTQPTPMFTQPWAWVGWTAIGVFTFIILGVAVLAWQVAVILTAWLAVPCAVICFALLRARPPRRRPPHAEA